MPRPAKGARLWLRPASRDENGAIVDAARWIIKDRGKQIGTGCCPRDHAEAERRLAAYIAEKYAPERRERPLSEICVGDVLKIYADDVIPTQARPDKAAERGQRLVAFFGDKTLDEITGKLCNEYVADREGKGRSNKGKGGGAKRDLEDLRAAINHHARAGYHRALVMVPLPSKGEARQRWMTRDEAAALLWTCWRTREIQEGQPTEKRPLRHLCRFLILGLYTGSRPGVIFSAAWDRGPGRSHIDLDRGVFHRHGDGNVKTNKRSPTVRLSPRLAAHLERWRRMDGGRGHVVTFDGEPIMTGCRTALTRAVKLSGIEGGVTAYTLRHSCASWLVAKGIPTRKVAEFVGTSEKMIIDHYGHLAPDYQDEAANAIGRK
jgi:integrase